MQKQQFSREQLSTQWDSMTPRQRDAWIAEHLFGFRRVGGPKFDYDGPCEYGDVLIPPTVSDDEAFRMMPFKGKVSLEYFVISQYNADISASMEVEEKIMQMDELIQIIYISHLERFTYLRWFRAGNKPFTIQKMRIVHACAEDRCKAAYLTVMEASQ